jgi:hypothetical protein
VVSMLASGTQDRGFASDRSHRIFPAGNIRTTEQQKYKIRTNEALKKPPVGAKFSAPVQTGPGAHPASYTMGTGSFPGVESGQGVTLTSYPILVPRSKNRVELYLYSP